MAAVNGEWVGECMQICTICTHAVFGRIVDYPGIIEIPITFAEYFIRSFSLIAWSGSGNWPLILGKWVSTRGRRQFVQPCACCSQIGNRPHRSNWFLLMSDTRCDRKDSTFSIDNGPKARVALATHDIYGPINCDTQLELQVVRALKQFVALKRLNAWIPQYNQQISGCRKANRKKLICNGNNVILQATYQV